ncbi:acyl-CoA dehydrogenase C-terminal domain-containing protein, partial [Paraburkholderia gardini]
EQRADDPSFYGAKIATAQFFAEHVLAQASALEASIVTAKGDEGVLALDADQF